jgi:hypothetical protein
MIYKISLVIIFAVLSSGLIAQTDIRNLPVNVELKIEQLQNIEIGWWGGLKKYDKPPLAKKQNGRTYSVKQISYSQKFIEWMQASYSPKGCLGDFGLYQNTGVDKYRNFGKLTAYYPEALPQLYGAHTKTYMFLKKDATGKFSPSMNFAEYWHIGANQLDYISQAINCLSSPAEHYFIMPRYEKNNENYFAQFDEDVSFLNFNNHPNLQPYQHYYIPPKLIGDNCWYVVLLTKNNSPLPVENITIGHFFERIEKNLPELFRTYYLDGYGKVNAPQGAWENAVTNLKALKANYQTSWNNEVRLRENTQISFIDILNARNGTFHNIDHAAGHEYLTFPILRLNKGVLEKCKTDEPQWIAIRWNLGMKEKLFNVHMMESILNNFNFKYVYDYFYGVTKPNTPYKPL